MKKNCSRWTPSSLPGPGKVRAKSWKPEGGNMIDLILEYNTNPYHKTINRGVPMNKEEREQFFEDKISDHLPYFVKVKIR